MTYANQLTSASTAESAVSEAQGDQVTYQDKSDLPTHRIHGIVFQCDNATHNRIWEVVAASSEYSNWMALDSMVQARSSSTVGFAHKIGHAYGRLVAKVLEVVREHIGEDQ